MSSSCNVEKGHRLKKALVEGVTIQLCQAVTMRKDGKKIDRIIAEQIAQNREALLSLAKK